MSQRERSDELLHVVQAQADDMFALYQLAQLLTEASDLDELVHLALPHLVRVCDSPYAALFLPLEPAVGLDLVALIGPDVEAGDWAEGVPDCPDGDAAAEWFRAACGVTARDCLFLPLDVGHDLSGLLALAAPSRAGFSRHQQHLIATMAREVARVLQVALARAELERRQRQVEQMQSDFVATVSHELRTPLALVQAGVDSLTHLTLTPEQYSRFIADIGQAAAHLTRVVDGILTFSQVEAGPWSLLTQPTDLAAVVERTARECGPGARRRLDLDVAPVLVRADPERLVQVLANLFTNALKYSPPDSAVRVRARPWPSHHMVRLAVGDRGQGVPPDEQPYLFGKFFRARNVRETSVAGTGLGLYICKRLVEAQGGTIRLRSHVGRGTTVRVCLPLADADAAATGAAQTGAG